MQPTRSSQVLFKNEQECIIRFKNSRRGKNELIYIRDFEAVQKTPVVYYKLWKLSASPQFQNAIALTSWQ